MGTYLSHPDLEKSCEDGEELNCITPVAWAAVDMQGWRKTMEDGHIAMTNVTPPGPTCLAATNRFRVVQEMHTSISIGLDKNDEGGSRSIAEFEEDALLQYEPKHTKVFAVFDGHGGPEVARFCELYFVDVLINQSEWKSPQPNIGQALINCFHALDRMIDDPKRRDEIMKLKVEKPLPGEFRRISQEISKQHEHMDDLFADEKKIEEFSSIGTDSMNDDVALNCNDDLEECCSEYEDQVIIRPPTSDDDCDNMQDDVRVIDGKPVTQLIHEELNGEDEDDDNLLNGDVGMISSDKAMSIFKKLLRISGASSADHASAPEQPQQIVGESNESDSSYDMQDNEPMNIENIDGPSVFLPTRIVNGKQICNLPEHPVHAGCTAICAVILGRSLYVANAGDSRAVLCRSGGIAEALSFDHKPSQEREMNRILQAGGFVNAFGRVNGNLNLSRSIGDLKYKQVPGIPPSGQMITAEPDIMEFSLTDSDEFIIMGCDGIWDCLSNEEAVAFVRQRIDLKTPREIGVEMLDTIVSVDPRITQGIGGDNMTIMIIDLMPHKRVYRMEQDDDDRLNRESLLDI